MNTLPRHTKITLALLAFLPAFFAVAALGTKFGIWGWKVGLLTLTLAGGGILLILTAVASVLPFKVHARSCSPALMHTATNLTVGVFIGAAFNTSSATVTWTGAPNERKDGAVNGTLFWSVADNLSCTGASPETFTALESASVSCMGIGAVWR
jgi:hypothetical protein